MLLLLFALATLLGLVSAVVDPANPCGIRQADRNYNVTISSEADVKAVLNCPKIGSNLVIEASFQGQAEFASIQIVEGAIRAGDVGALQGDWDDITIEDSDLTGLSFPFLRQTDKIQIVGLGALETLDFPSIKEVSSVIDLFYLPSLETWTGFNSLNYSADTYIINTGLSTIAWNSSESRHPTTGTIYISNNTELELVNLYNPLKIDNLVVNGNGQTKIGLGAETVRHLSITGCGGYADYNYGSGNGFNDIRAISNLYGFDGYIQLWNNTFEVIRFDSLEHINGSVEIHNNPNLVNVSMWNLFDVNGYVDITDNDALKIISASDFRSLGAVRGSVNLTGAYEDIDLQPNINITNSFTIDATGNVTCATYDGKYANGYYAWGDTTDLYGCAANGSPLTYQSHSSSSSPGSSSGSNSGSSSGSHSSKHGLSRAAFWAIVIAIPVPLGLTFWIALIWYLCMRHKRKKTALAAGLYSNGNAPPMHDSTPYQTSSPALATGGRTSATQLYSTSPYTPEVTGIAPRSVFPERKPVPPTAVVLDHSSTLTLPVNDPSLSADHDHGITSARSSISKDSRTDVDFAIREGVGRDGYGVEVSNEDLERREAELKERERIIQEMERERREEELERRELAVREREREIREWEERRKGGG